MSEWKKCQLGDLITFQRGHDLPKTKMQGGKYPVVGSNGIIGYHNEYTTEAPSITIGRSGNVGKPFLFKGRSWSHNTSLYIKEYKAVDPIFIYYFLQTLDLGNYAGGSAVPTLNRNHIHTLNVYVPTDIDEQRRIGAVLSVIDDKIELNTAINENLEQQIQAILLNMIQQDSKKDRIETVKLGEYLYIKGRIGWKGLKKDEYLDSSDYRIINGESLTKDGIDWNKAGFISKERYDESPEIMLQVGDILLSKDGTIGKIGYVDNLDSPSTVASGIFVIRNIKPDIISTQFIYYLLKSKLFSAFIASRTEGSVIPHLYQKDFMEFAFPLPNADEMSQFDALTSPLFATVIKNLRENEFLTATRDALLPKLMNGEIDVSAVKI